MKIRELPSHLEVNGPDDGYFYVEEKGKPGEGAYGAGKTIYQAINDYFLHYNEKGELI